MRYLVLGFAFFLSACVSQVVNVRPQIETVSAKIANIDFQGVDLLFDVGIRNPWAFSIKTPQFRYALDVAEGSFTSGDITSTVDLPARGLGIAKIPLRMKYIDLWNMHRNLSNANEVPYRLKGTFLIPALGTTFELPLEHSDTFPVLKMPNFSALKFHPAKITMGTATIGIDVEALNPNSFWLGIKDLGYVLRIGDMEIGGLHATANEILTAGGKGRITLEARVSAFDMALQFLTGARLGQAKLVPIGRIETPFNLVTVPE